MRAGRLVSLVLLLQERGRVNATTLARELEVSERTILRDIEELSGAGVPVYAVRGPGGGFQLLEGDTSAFPASSLPASSLDRSSVRATRTRRARVRVTPEGRRLAAVLGKLQPLRLTRGPEPDAAGRLAASFRLLSMEEATMDVLALAPHVEVLTPTRLRDAIAERARVLADLHAPAAGGEV